jgi:fumarate hydratase subunit beta
MASYHLTTPISEDAIRALHVGDAVRLSGVMVTARDAAHRYIVETFVESDSIPESERLLCEELRRLLGGGVIYHCGPVVHSIPPQPSPPHGGREAEGWRFVAAGPTTSIREEPYEADIIAHFGVRAVIGKGGMGPATLRALQAHGAAYLHAVGGAAALIASTVKEVIAVHKLEEFGAPEAFWVVRTEDFPAVVTMDSHERSIHDQIEATSAAALGRLLGGAT